MGVRTRFKLIAAVGTGPAPQIVPPTDVAGLRVSTVDTVDCGPETAIVDAVTTYPVERYETRAQAEAGHRAWVERAPGLTRVTCLGYDEIPAEDVELVKRGE